jgi:hypothetical protein
LKREGGAGQTIPNDRFEPALAEGAPRLLIGKNVLEANDLLCERRHPCLRCIDHRQSFIQSRELFAGCPSRGLEPRSDPCSDRIEALGDKPRKVGLPRPQYLCHAAYRAAKPRIVTGGIRQCMQNLALALHSGICLLALRTATARKAPGDYGKQVQGKSCDGKENVSNRNWGAI